MTSLRTRRNALKALAAMTGLAAGSVVLTSCGDQQAVETPVAGSGQLVSFELKTPTSEAGFDQVRLEAPAGSRITMKLINQTKDKRVNLVVSKPGRMLRVVTNGAVEGEANGYVKPGDPDVIAHTPLIEPGQSAEITFDAPPPGQYQYFSTWPGYYTIMNGVLTIK